MIRNENMPAMIWIDAIEFQEYGGWKKDTQFTHLMGSAYLLACDIPGKPVENARMAVYVPQNGMYRIWTRAKNWYAPYAPGKFTVAVDGKRAAAVLGAAPSRRWVWQIADDFFLEKGEHVLELIDLTGYMGRCSTLLLTTDMDYLPQSDIAAFEKERARLKRLPNMPTNGGNYDVIVVGEVQAELLRQLWLREAVPRRCCCRTDRSWAAMQVRRQESATTGRLHSNSMPEKAES